MKYLFEIKKKELFLYKIIKRENVIEKRMDNKNTEDDE